MKIRTYLTLMLTCCSYGCETWFLTMREEHRLRVFENSVQRKKCRPERDGVKGECRNYIMRSLMICTAHKTFGNQMKNN